MTDEQIKNHEMDQSVCFDVEKTQDVDALNTDLVRGRDALRSSKIRQESSTLKPMRKKRRQLTGW